MSLFIDLQIKQTIHTHIVSISLLKIFIFIFSFFPTFVNAMDVNTTELFNPASAVYDVTNTAPNTIKTMQLVEKTLVQVDAISGLMPREIKLGACSETGCPIDAVQCDAVTELPSCPSGSVLNATRDMCQKDPDVFECPSGFNYDNMLGKCVKPLECPSGGEYNVSRNRCEFKRIYECPVGYTQEGNTCVAPPTCPSNAIFNPTTLKCELDATYACADAGWTYEAATNKCWIAPPTCPSGYVYNTTYDKCFLTYTKGCPSGYTFNSTRDRCEKTPDCPSGTTYNAATNRCEQGAGSACTLSGGTWNGSTCTVGGSYTATVNYINNSYTYSLGSFVGEMHLSNYYTDLPTENPSSVSISNGFTQLDIPYNGIIYSYADSSTFSGAGNGYCFRNKVISYDHRAKLLSYNYDLSGSLCGGFALTYSITFVYSNVPVYTCPSGGTLSGTTCNTTSNVAPSCPVGYTHDGSGKCYANPTCPSSGSFDGNLDLCYVSFTKTCSSGTYDSSVDQCVQNATCAKGVLNPSKDRCEQDYVPVCGTGWTFNSATQFCEKNPVCIIGTYSNTYDKCVLAYTPTCVSGYTYNSTRTRCEKTPPDCPNGTTYNVTTNRCEQSAGSACTLVGGTWNGTNCTVNGSYAATATNSGGDIFAIWGKYPIDCYPVPNFGTYDSGYGLLFSQRMSGSGRNSSPYGCTMKNTTASTIEFQYVLTQYTGTYDVLQVSSSMYIPSGGSVGFGFYGGASAATHTWVRVIKIVYTCPSGGTLSGSTCNTTSNVAASCPIGYTHDGSGRCYANPTCPSSGSFDGVNDICYLTFGKSCTSGSYDTISNACVLDPICDEGILNTTLDKCQLSRDVVCSIGVKDLVTGKCTFVASCQSNATLVVDKCTNYPIPLTCPSGTDTTLDVCYSNVNDCYVDNSYINANTLAYSASLKTCLVEEKIACATGLTWSETYIKCEAVPICYNGMYNPENDFCYISTKECPINSSYPCKGPIGNKWCSPYECNPTTNQCGYAKCSSGYPPTSKEEPTEQISGLILNTSDSVCMDMSCYFSNSSRISYCGTEATCPKGFGVFQQGSNCYQSVCPPTSQELDGSCYELK